MGSTKREIYLFDYERETGEISNQQVFIKTPNDEGVPDGMTVDQGGYVWSARWDGHGLFRFDTEGNLERKIEFPTAMVSSVTFGGEDKKKRKRRSKKKKKSDKKNNKENKEKTKKEKKRKN